MPHFDFDEQEATAIADFLFSVSKDGHGSAAYEFKKDDASQGQQLLMSLGCAACHQVADGRKLTTPPAAPYEGPELLTVSAANLDFI